MHNSWLVKANPNTWESATVEELFYVKGRIGWRGLRRSQFTDHGPYLITGMHISEGIVQWDDCFHISEDKFQESPEIIVEIGDIIITKDGTIGKVAYIDYLPGPTSLNSHLFLVRPKVNRVDRRFAYHIFTSWLFNQHINDHQTGSTLSGLSEKLFLRFNLPLPPPQEQRRIADILDAIDTQIRNTEQLIAKLQFQKTGLLNDLLTRGLDKSGQLRDLISHPEQFKVSVLGTLPKEWEIANLGAIILQNGGLIQTGPFGSQLHAHEYVAEGVPVIMPQDIQNGHINEAQAAHIAPERAKSLARHYVEFNDVIFARRGDLGRCTFIDAPQVGWICGTGCLLVRPPKSVDGRWLAATYRHNYSQRQILARAVGSTMVNLNTTLLTNLIVAKPPLAEQVAIVEKTDILDISIRTEEAYYNKLELYKKSLMQDLLSGYISMKSDEKILSKASPLYKEPQK